METSVTMKTTAGVIGLVAYPAQAIYKSIYTAIKGTTRRKIEDAKYIEGEWLVKSQASVLVNYAVLIAKFETRNRGN